MLNRIDVENDPVNWVDPWGLESLSGAFGTSSPSLTYGVDSNGGIYPNGASTGSPGESPPTLTDTHKKVQAFLNAGKTLEQRQKMYEPYLRSRVDEMGHGVNLYQSAQFPPGHPLVSGFQYSNYLKENPNGSYLDFWLRSLFPKDKTCNGE